MPLPGGIVSSSDCVVSFLERGHRGERSESAASGRSGQSDGRRTRSGT